MSTFYEVNTDGESEFYISYRQAMWAAIDAAKFGDIVRLDRIETPRINKDLVLSVLNKGHYVEERETIVVFEYCQIKEPTTQPQKRAAKL